MSHVRTQLQMLASTVSSCEEAHFRCNRFVQDPSVPANTQGKPAEQNANGKQNSQGGQSLALVTNDGAQHDSAAGNGGKADQNTSWLGLDASDMFDEKIEYCRHEHVRLMHRLIKVMGRLERLQCVGTPRT